MMCSHKDYMAVSRFVESLSVLLDEDFVILSTVNHGAISIDDICDKFELLVTQL